MKRSCEPHPATERDRCRWNFFRENSGSRREINLRANGRFIHPTEFLKPTEKSFAGSMRKRTLRNRFPWAGRLSNEHYLAHNRSPRDRRRLHTRTTTAAQEASDMLIESSLDSSFSHGLWAVRTQQDHKGQTSRRPVAKVLEIASRLKAL
jgi:hypothetical protein